MTLYEKIPQFYITLFLIYFNLYFMCHPVKVMLNIIGATEINRREDAIYLVVVEGCSYASHREKLYEEL